MIRDTFFDIMGSGWPTIVIFLVIVSFLRISYLISNKQKFVFYKEAILLLFLAYILLLFELVTEKDVAIASGTNFIPLKEILRYKFGSKLFLQQVLGNIILFIPFGLFASYYVNAKKASIVLIISLLSSLVIETVQYFIGRSFDVDDIILNTLGGVLGFILFIALDAIRKHLPSFLQRDIVYNILMFVIVLFFVFYLFDFFHVWGL